MILQPQKASVKHPLYAMFISGYHHSTEEAKDRLQISRVNVMEARAPTSITHLARRMSKEAFGRPCLCVGQNYDHRGIKDN